MSREEICRDIGDLIEMLGRLQRWRELIPRACLVASATIARTDTVQKELFTIPAGHEGHLISVQGDTGSDLATLSSLDLGTIANPTLVLNGHSVLGILGVGQKMPDVRKLGQVNANDVTLYGRYSETGLPSTTGGPWTITLLYSRAGN